MAGFKTGWSGSPFHTGYNADKGMNVSEDADSPGGPRIGTGKEGKKVDFEVNTSKSPKKGD